MDKAPSKKSKARIFPPLPAHLTPQLTLPHDSPPVNFATTWLRRLEIPPALSSRFARLCLLLGMFLLIWGAKLWIINRFATASPFQDQWHGDGPILEAYVNHTLSPAQFFALHNEHRVAFSRLLCLILVILNGQWDNILETVAQAPLYILAVLAIVSVTSAGMSPLARAAFAAFATAICMIPFGWENTLWGFQSAFYFAILAGIIVIWFCWRFDPLTPRWWAGALLAFASLFTIGSGVFFVLAAAGFMAARILFDRPASWKTNLPAAILFLAIAAFGIHIIPTLPNHDNLVAHGARDILTALTGVLSWPCNFHWACIILQAPFIILLLVSLIHHIPFSDRRWFALAVGMAFYIQALATAYKRFAFWDASRYSDSWAILLIINCAALYFLIKSLRLWAYPCVALWLAVASYGALDTAINRLPGELQDRRSLTLFTENNIRSYYSSGDWSYITGIVAHPNPGFRELLDSPSLRPLLPPGLHSPAPALVPASQRGNTGFTPGGVPPGLLPPLPVPFIGSWPQSGHKVEGELTMVFNAPPRTRQIDLRIAGYPNSRGIELSIKDKHAQPRRITLPSNPRELWQTISIPINSPSFTLKAKDQSQVAWFAFSLPTPSTFHPVAHLARLLAANSIAIIDIGLILFAIATLASLHSARGILPSSLSRPEEKAAIL